MISAKLPAVDARPTTLETCLERTLLKSLVEVSAFAEAVIDLVSASSNPSKLYVFHTYCNI
jgi:hypothetical protein